ncbi:hypothetical protein RS9917_00457 [Synechococcus sp. RS9917]|nr:hypothetical protein RS9917_00457 [Synechococcus sp. RS9917]
MEFPASPSFEQVMDLKLALEDLLSVPVDLVTRRVSCCRWSAIDRPWEGAPASPTATL